jgi:methyl-accepting chemotaxis protein
MANDDEADDSQDRKKTSAIAAGSDKIAGLGRRVQAALGTIENLVGGVSGAEIGGADHVTSRAARMAEDTEAIVKNIGLLALDATIEAARIVEAGHGFVVVAGEMKALADQAAQVMRSIRTGLSVERSAATR